ncbi:MAG: glycosyltransferase family 9 protein [Burkholderiales bacterium]|nr:glycosyltransferase family 9 protein [Burkholderiales bacterium]
MKQFLLNMRAVLWAMFDGLAVLTSSREPRRNLILVIRLDAIGDFVLWLDAARALVHRYRAQGYSVVLVGNSAWGRWAREMGVANEIWEIDVRRFIGNLLYRWRWLHRIRKAGFKIAIQPTYSRDFLVGDSLVRSSCADQRIGSVGDEANIAPQLKSWSDRWYTRLVPATSMKLMELSRNAEFMRGLGFTDFVARVPTIAQISNIGNVGTNWLPRRPYAVLSVAASWQGREWPIANFIDIGQRLVIYGLHVVVVGAPADRCRFFNLFNALQDKVTDLVGKTTLGDLAEVLRCATVVVTNETSAVHMGAAVGSPVVCVLGGGHFGRFAPYETEVTEGDRYLPIFVSVKMECFGCNWHCKYSRQRKEAVKCINDISVEKVWSAVETVLNAHKRLRE